MELATTPLADALARGVEREILELVAPYYEDPAPLVARELGRCDAIYTARDGAGVLQAFFLVGWRPITIGAESVPAVYLGLSANRPETRRTFKVAELYARFAEDARRWEESNGRDLVLWFTTATPAAYVGAERVFGGLQPDRSGALTPGAREALAALRATFGAAGEPNGHPAVLRGVARDVRYSAAERETIRRVAARAGCSILDDLGVDAEAGDRMLCVCRTRRGG